MSGICSARPATVNNLAMVAGRMSKADIGMLSPRTRAALGIGG